MRKSTLQQLIDEIEDAGTLPAPDLQLDCRTIEAVLRASKPMENQVALVQWTYQARGFGYWFVGIDKAFDMDAFCDRVGCARPGEAVK